MKATIIYSIWLHHRLFHAFNVARRSSVQYKTELWVQNCHMKWADKEYRQSSIEETPRPNYRWNFIEILLKLDQKWKKKNQREGNRTYCIDDVSERLGRETADQVLRNDLAEGRTMGGKILQEICRTVGGPNRSDDSLSASIKREWNKKWNYEFPWDPEEWAHAHPRVLRLLSSSCRPSTSGTLLDKNRLVGTVKASNFGHHVTSWLMFPEGPAIFKPRATNNLKKKKNK
jgi:hypothetical protein